MKIVHDWLLSQTEEALRTSAKTKHVTTYMELLRRSVASLQSPDDIDAKFVAKLFAEFEKKNLSRAAVKAFVLVAAKTGQHSHDDFFTWVKKYQDELLGNPNAGLLLSDTTKSRCWKRTKPFAYKAGGRTSCSAVTFDTQNEFCVDLLCNFIDSTRPAPISAGGKQFFGRFVESLGFDPTRLTDFTTQTFSRQVSFVESNFAGSYCRSALLEIRRFYIFVMSLMEDHRETFSYASGLTKEFLIYDKGCTLWTNGYRTVLYNPLDPIPASTKWILFPNADETRSSSLKPDAPFRLNLTVSDAALEDLLASWIWSGELSSSAVRTAPAYAKAMLEAIAEEGPSITLRESDTKRVVTATLLSRFISAKTRDLRPSTMRHVKTWLDSLLRFGERKGVLSVEPACYMHLSKTVSERKDSGSSEIGAAEIADIVQVANELERRSESSLLDELCYIAFCTQALTSLRISEVLSLNVNQIDDEPRKGLHAVRVSTKTDGAGFRRVQVPTSVYRLLDAARRLTDECRGAASNDVGSYLFIAPGELGAIRTLKQQTYRAKLKDTCDKLGIPTCNPQNVRKRHLTEVIEKGVANNLSRLALRPLTGHATERVTNKFYLREDIRNYLEATNGIMIGNPRILGDIIDDEELRPDPSNLVEGGAGICRNPECSISGTITCLMCPGFATSPQFIPEMKEAVAMLSEQIRNAAHSHDREHLVAVKRLYVAYLGKMLEKKEGADGTSDCQK